MSATENIKALNVLVLGYDTHSFLAVIRSLGRKNISIHIGWYKNNPPLHSKYVVKKWEIPPYSPTEDTWKETLIHILKTIHFDLVIPCHDGTILPLQHHREELEKYGRIYLLENKTFNIANDKIKTNSLARRLGIPVPKGIHINSDTTCKDILALFNFPIVMKPRSSHTLSDINRKRYVKRVRDLQELESYLGTIPPGDELEACENFVGSGVGIELIASNGKILYAFQHIRIHEPLEGGGSSYRKSVFLQTDLLEASRKLIAELNYSGVAMVEYKVNFDTKEWGFMEINPRFWGSLPLAVAAGADFPYFLFQMLTKGKKTFPVRYKTGIYCRSISDDIEWFIANFFASKKDKTLCSRSLWQVVTEILNIAMLKERNDTFVFDDLRPGIAEFREILLNYRQRFFNKALFKINSMKVVRIIHKHNARRALQNAKSLLFVCKGNICRSPFAQLYYEKVSNTRLKSMSAGYYPKTGRFSPDGAVKAATHFGIDLSTHKSRVISSRLVHNSDIIFCFDEENLDTLKEMYPEAKCKLFPMTAMITHGAVTIDDPYGKNAESYRETYKTIAGIVDNINRVLEKIEPL